MKYREYKKKKSNNEIIFKKYEYIFKFVRVNRLIKKFIMKININYKMKKLKLEHFQLSIEKGFCRLIISDFVLNDLYEEENGNDNYFDNDNTIGKSNILENDYINNFNLTFISRRGKNLKYLRFINTLQCNVRIFLSRLKVKQLSSRKINDFEGKLIEKSSMKENEFTKAYYREEIEEIQLLKLFNNDKRFIDKTENNIQQSALLNKLIKSILQIETPIKKELEYIHISDNEDEVTIEEFSNSQIKHDGNSFDFLNKKKMN